MAEKFIIDGKNSLEGEIEVNGSKNAAGAILAATLLTSEECIIDNLPKVSDILSLLDILEGIGKSVEWIGERKIKIKDNGISPEKLDFEKISKSRVSVLLMGALLPQVKEFKFSRPGGDRIGLRPIDIHLSALRELGAEIEEDGDFYYLKSKHLKGKEIVLPEFSVTATENLIMASVFADGETIIKLAAQEPQVQDLISILNKMGAKIKGNGTHTLRIEGVKRLRGIEHRIIPDTNEAGTFLTIGAATAKRLLVKDLIIEHLDIFLLKLKEMGVNFVRKSDNSVEIYKPEKFFPAKIQALPYPGFLTDILPLTVPLLTQARGKSLIHDTHYENRLSFVHQLRKMGADIEIIDPHRALIFGPTPLTGMTIDSWDIRAGAALVVAGMIAQGTTVIENIEQIDRGYEKIEERLQRLGANIKRIEN